MKINNRLNYLLLLLMWTCLTFGCHSKPYQPRSNLRKLSSAESMERNLNEIPPAMDVKFKNTAGEELSEEALAIMHKTGEYFMDEYVDENDLVKEFVLRKSTKKDKEWTEEFLQRLHEKENTPLATIEVDCHFR